MTALQQITVPAVIIDTRVSRHYKTMNLLGKGGFASVYQVQETGTNYFFACKVTPKERLAKRKLLEKFQQEIKIHKMLKHYNICECQAVFKDQQNYYILLELCDQMTLSHLFKKRGGLSEEEVYRVAYETLSAVQYLQQNQIVHRDLKSSNIFLKKQNGTLVTKIGDFGLSAMIENNANRFTLCGTPNFLSPEIIASHVARRLAVNIACDPNIDEECVLLCYKLTAEFQQGHAYKTDVWSLGCVFYQLAFARAPFESSSITLTYKKILKGEFSFPQRQNKKFSQYFYKFVAKMLYMRPSDRPSVVDLLYDPWLKGGYAVKLRGLPEQVKQADFNAQYYASQPMRKFLNYSESIEERCAYFLDNFYGTYQMQYPNMNFAYNQGAGQSANFATNYALNCNLSVGSQSQALGYQAHSAAIQNAVATVDLDPVQTLQQYFATNFATFKINGKLYQTPDPSRVPPLYYCYFYNEQIVPSYTDPLDDYEKAGHIAAHYKLSFTRFHIIQYVYSWCDYQDKYGFAYQLSNGAIGAYFNDNTVLVVSPNKVFVDYQENDLPARRAAFSDCEALAGLKKTRLIKYFIEVLENRSIAPITEKYKENADMLFVGYNLKLFYKDNSIAHSLSNFDVDYARNVAKSLTETYIANMRQINQSDKLRITDLNLVEEIICQKLIKYGKEQQIALKKYKNEQSSISFLFNNGQFYNNNNETHCKIVIDQKYLLLLNESRRSIAFQSDIVIKTEFMECYLGNYITGLIYLVSPYYQEFNNIY